MLVFFALAGTAGVGRAALVAVLALGGVSPQTKWKLSQLLADSGKVAVFDSAWIGATAREVDLQLTGEMASPANAGVNKDNVLSWQ